MRVFYDTNVVLSVLLWPGVANRLHLALVEHGLLPLTSEGVIAEALAVVRRKFPELSPAAIEAAIRAGWEVGLWAGGRPSVPLRDPDDDAVLASAEAARADVFLTGDKDLLNVADQITTLRVMSLRQLADAYSILR